MTDRFPSPFDMPTPPGAEGWQQLYAYSLVFSEDRREAEDVDVLVQDGVHTPEVLPPWDSTIFEFAIISLSQYNTRHYVIPPALGRRRTPPERLPVPLPRRGARTPRTSALGCPSSLERAGYYYAELGPALRGLDGEDADPDRRARDGIVHAAAGPRGDVRPHRGRRHWAAARPRDRVQPAARPDAQAVELPLRVPQPRLRGLPRLLRLLQGRLPEHPRPGHRQDGRRHRGRPLPAGRGAQEARPAWPSSSA